MPPQIYQFQNRAGQRLRYFREHYPMVKDRTTKGAASRKNRPQSQIEHVKLSREKFIDECDADTYGFTVHKLRQLEEGITPLTDERVEQLVELGYFFRSEDIYKELLRLVIKDWEEIDLNRRQQKTLVVITKSEGKEPSEETEAVEVEDDPEAIILAAIKALEDTGEVVYDSENVPFDKAYWEERVRNWPPLQKEPERHSQGAPNTGRSSADILRNQIPQSGEVSKLSPFLLIGILLAILVIVLILVAVGAIR